MRLRSFDVGLLHLLTFLSAVVLGLLLLYLVVELAADLETVLSELFG
ncbi:hypothetical protein [Halobaculum sp. MBLA0143]